MAGNSRAKFATQVDGRLLADLRHLSRREGRQIQTLVEEALTDLIVKRKQDRPRTHVMATYRASHKKYATLYKKLAE